MNRAKKGRKTHIIGPIWPDYLENLITFGPILKPTTMTIEQEILQILHYHPLSNRAEIAVKLTEKPSDRTLKRIISNAIEHNLISVTGRGPATRYSITPQAHLLMPMNIDTYFSVEIDQREIQSSYNFELINELLPSVEIFSTDELATLNEAQKAFQGNISQMTEREYRKEMERLGVDLSWKSAQIEGNTYSLLETERLLKERQEATGKSREEAIMLLNHKDALDFILDTPDYLSEISTHKIEDIHSILVQGLNVDKNIRSRRVGITGTNYHPLDVEFQIREALDDMCRLINGKANVFEKALLALVLLSYIQAFADGNKRTARIISNAILIANGHCPLSFRTVDSIDYKKAMLIFYEQNNLSAFKSIFIDQFLFATQTYF